ncbi:MAG: collagen-like protein [Cytophagales bacterium]|nr:collagen-like protein [Cytophagales bacterium]
MKQILITTGIVLLLSACSDNIGPQGPQVPQGPQGFQGEPGESGYIMEWEGVSFTSPGYEVFLNYNDFSFEGVDSDVTLVYLLWGTEEVDGEIVEIWRPLQQTVLTEDGILQYTYDFTKYDTKIFLDSTFDLDRLSALDTDDWVVRVAVIPGEILSSNGRIDLDYHKLVEALNLPVLDKEETVIQRR